MSDPGPLFRDAIRRLQSGDPVASRQLAELERFPDYGPGWLALGSLLQQSGKLDAALVALGRAARAQPASAPTGARAAHRLGQCLIEQGRRDAAIASFHDALRLVPDFAEAWYSLGLACQDAGDLTAAIQAYRAALQARPDFHEAALNLGIVLQETGALDDALDAYGTALHLRPDSLARIAQALTSGRKGTLWLDPQALRHHLSGARGTACDNGPSR